jgi:hypothetical protein
MEESFVPSNRISNRPEYQPGGKWYNKGKSTGWDYDFGNLCKRCGYPFGDHSSVCPGSRSWFHVPDSSPEFISINPNITIL